MFEILHETRTRITQERGGIVLEHVTVTVSRSWKKIFVSRFRSLFQARIDFSNKNPQSSNLHRLNIACTGYVLSTRIFTRGFHPWYSTAVASFWKCQRWTFGTVPKLHSLYFAYRYNCLTLPRLDFWKIKASLYALFFSPRYQFYYRTNLTKRTSFPIKLLTASNQRFSKRTNSRERENKSTRWKTWKDEPETSTPPSPSTKSRIYSRTRVQKTRVSRARRVIEGDWRAEFVGQSLNSIGIGDSWINCATIAAGRTPTRVDAHRGGRLSFSSR